MKFTHPGFDRISAMRFPNTIKVSIYNNIETKAEIHLDKNEALRLATELLISIVSADRVEVRDDERLR